MKRGPIEVMALGFPRGVTPHQMVTCLRRPVDSGHVRLVDLVFLLRADDGTLEARDVEHERFPLPGLAGLTFDPHTLLSETDVDLLALSLGPDQQGLVAVVEHTWATVVAAELDELGAELTLYARVPPDDVDLAFAFEDAAG